MVGFSCAAEDPSGVGWGRLAEHFFGIAQRLRSDAHHGFGCERGADLAAWTANDVSDGMRSWAENSHAPIIDVIELIP